MPTVRSSSRRKNKKRRPQTCDYRSLSGSEESAVPRQYSLVRFRFDQLPANYHNKYPFTPNKAYVFFGEIPNMPGHCVVADHSTGRVYSGYHTENFAEIPEA